MRAYLKPRSRFALSRPAALRGIAGFEKLRAEWISANPEHSEFELLTACVGFARGCGLILREKLLQAMLRDLERAAA